MSQEELEMTARAEAFAINVFAAAQKAKQPIPDEYRNDLVEVSGIYLELVDGEPDQALVDEYTTTIQSMISDWSWEGVEVAEEAFWREALNTVVAIAKPAAKEILKMAAQAAVDAAVSKVEKRLT